MSRAGLVNIASSLKILFSSFQFNIALRKIDTRGEFYSWLAKVNELNTG